RGEALVLDADGARVVVPVPGMPGDVLFGHHLPDAARLAGDVVGRPRAVGILEGGDRAVDAALDVVDDDVVDLVGLRPVGNGVVGGIGGRPRRGGIVRPAHRGRATRRARREKP